MPAKRILSVFLASTLCVGMLPGLSYQAKADDSVKIPIFQDPSYSFAERAADLVARMTPAQKGSQMISNNSAAIPAEQLGGGALDVPATVGVNAYTWWSEALHGYSYATPGSTNSTSYPQNLSVGSTWNPDLYHQEATMISDEIRERTNKVSSGLNAGNGVNLTFYSPTVNLQRDPRWGRNEESYSEDPFLQSMMGNSFVTGMEGKDQNGTLLDEQGHLKAIATIKHYTANNSERNRLDGGAVTDLRALREYYTAPYRNIIKSADVSSVMTAYSTLNGEPCSISSYLMETLLRQTWGFSGYITGDCDSVSTIARHNYVNPHTGSVLTAVEQLSQAMAHGEDLECSGGYNSGVGTYSSSITSMINAGVATDKGVFTENQVDVSLERLMTARMQTGEFDYGEHTPAYTTSASERVTQQQIAPLESSVYWQTPERLAMAENVAKEAVVLLKNANPEGSDTRILPLPVPKTGDYKIAIVGSWQTNMYLGLYSTGQNVTTNQINIQKGITDAIHDVNPNVTFTYITSNTLTDQNQTDIAAANAVIVVAGTDNNYSAEDKDRTSTVLPNNQAAFISQVGKLNKNTVAVLETCGPVQVTAFENDVAGILWSSFGGMRKGVGFGSVISGAVNPSGKLTSSWYKTVSDTGDSDIPAITDYNIYHTNGDSGRTYMYYSGEVSYPFGYGLSYTTYQYRNLKIQKGSTETAAFSADDTATVSFDVTNTGSVAGKETVELYVAQPDAPADLNRPIKRLEGFKKVALNPGETQTVTLNVKISDLAFYNEEEDRYVVDTGTYEFQVGTNSQSISLNGRIQVSGSMTIVPAVLTAKPNQAGDPEKGIEERLIFGKNKVVNPQLTVSMNDESLCGYIIRDQKSPIKQMSNNVEFPDGMTFTYSSNRPSVVSVENNVIKTMAPGVATITAKATYHGATVSTDFVVYVESTSYLDGITVGGTPIADFKGDRMNYAIELPSGTAQVPQIAAVTDNTDLTLKITQATKLPGVATIEVTNNYTSEKLIYRIGFGTKPVTTDLKEGWDAALAKGWTVTNGNENAVFSNSAGLTIATEQGAFSSATIQPKNLYMQPALGNWVAQTKVILSASPSASNQQAGLIVYDTDQNYIRFVYERPTSGSTNTVRVYSVVDGVQTQINSANLASQTSLYFQIVKQGTVYTFKYSADGSTWSTFGKTVTATFAFPQIGLWANNGDTAAASISASFEKLSIYEPAELYPRLTSIRVDGVPLAAFNPETFSYNFEATDQAHIPVITAESSYPVTISQLTGPVGTATITVSSAAASVTYQLYYNYNPASDYFADGTVGDQWTVLREDTTAYAVKKGLGIEMPTQRYDIYSTGGAWKNCFVQPAMGNWEVVAKAFYPTKPTGDYQQAMLLVWQDENNYIRVNCQQNSLRIEPGMEINGSFAANGLSQAYATANSDGSVTLYFKIKKDQSSYEVSYSQDGLNYTSLGTINNVNFSNPQIGLFATQNSTVTPINAYFEYLTLTNLNGVKLKEYSDMLQDAVQNALNYVVADIPSSTNTDIVFDSLPHGYTLNVASSNPDVIGASGQVVPDTTEDKTVTLTVSVSDGTRTANSSPITVIVPKVAMRTVAAVTATPKAGSYLDAKYVTLSTLTEGASIYYTTDESTPDTDSTLYTAPIPVSQGMTIKAVAVKDGWLNSNIATFAYQISSSIPVDDAQDKGDDNEPAFDVPPLWKEFKDYFKMGTFGDWSSTAGIYHWNSSAPANALKLDSEIGSSNTDSVSRKTYLNAVAAIEADTSLSAEEKEARLQEANENVVLDMSSINRSGGPVQILDGIRAWNAAHPGEEPKMVRAHVLAWHGSQQPNYFFCNGFVYDASNPDWASPKTMLARLDNYIREMMAQYADYNDIIYCWDVVNEAIDDYSGQIRNSEDYQVGQWGTVFRRKDLDNSPDDRLYAESEWVRQAFASARHWSVENGCTWKLYYNDFQDSNKLYEPKMSQTIKMLKPIYEGGNIDGYGMQGRLSYAYPTIDMLKHQIDLGLTVANEISISESDVRSDFVTNPNYDPSQPTRRVQEGDPEWPEGSGSYSNISSANGNTFDVNNSPVMRNPDWGYGQNNDLANSPEIMRAQADFIADWMDLLISYKGKVTAYQWDGQNDSNTYNSSTGCTMWASDGTEKYSFFACAGAPNRDKMKQAIASGPSDAEQGLYSVSSWTAYHNAKAAAQALVDVRIYTQEGLDAVKTATANLKAAIANLETTAPESSSFLSKGHAGDIKIINQSTSRIIPGLGLLLTDTRGTIDNGESSSSYKNVPVDLVKTSAAGDWIATVKLKFNGGSRLGYYEYFQFVAMQDMDNYTGFTVGDGGIYLNTEKDGVVTGLTSSQGSTKIADVNYYRIQKSGDDYTFFYSADGKNFVNVGTAVDTGLTDVDLAFDAYCTNQWSGKNMYVEYLHIQSDSSTESMSDFALRSALEYTVAALGDSVVFPSGINTVQLPSVSGYTTTFDAENTDIISSDGLVTAPDETSEVAVCVSVSDGTNQKTSEPITLTVSGMSYQILSVIFTPGAMDQVDGDLRATVSVSNTTASEQTGLMVVALYDEDGRMINYNCVGKTVAAGQQETFESGFRVPFEKGGYEGYTVKVFVWDGTNMGNTKGLPLSPVTVMPSVSAQGYDLVGLSEEAQTDPQTPDDTQTPGSTQTPDDTQAPDSSTQTPDDTEAPGNIETPANTENAGDLNSLNAQLQ